jgi:hypothetical protein
VRTTGEPPEELVWPDFEVHEHVLLDSQRHRGLAGWRRWVGDWTASFPEWETERLERVELVEGATRSGQPELAADAFARQEPITRAGDTDWARGIQARAHALLSHGEAAERLYREAIERLGRTRLRGELAQVEQARLGTGGRPVERSLQRCPARR